VPLFATLLSLLLPADYIPLTVSPEQQKQQTLHALLTILLRIATQQPVLFVMEDLHWVDPTTKALRCSVSYGMQPDLPYQSPYHVRSGGLRMAR
jgi:hypothetical protein